jgi:hypothetical protein
MGLRAQWTVRRCFAAVIALLAMCGCYRSPDLPHMARVPNFQLRDQNARTVSSEQLRGSV